MPSVKDEVVVLDVLWDVRLLVEVCKELVDVGISNATVVLIGFEGEDVKVEDVAANKSVEVLRAAADVEVVLFNESTVEEVVVSVTELVVVVVLVATEIDVDVVT